MYRGIIIGGEETPLTEDEISFYLPYIIDSYNKLVSRMRRRDVIFTTSYVSAFVLSFVANPSSETTLPLIGIEISSALAAASFFFIGSMAAFLTAFDRSAAIAYISEIGKLHRLKYGTDLPLWYLGIPHSLGTLRILSPDFKLYSILYWIFVFIVSATICSIAINFMYLWNAHDWVVRSVYLVGFSVYILATLVFQMLKRSDKENTSKLQERFSKMGPPKSASKCIETNG